MPHKKEFPMDDLEDPLDLLNDDGDGVVEMCLLGEEEELKKKGMSGNSGCCLVFLIICSSLAIAGWYY
jgi:hypothetical protein